MHDMVLCTVECQMPGNSLMTKGGMNIMIQQACDLYCLISSANWNMLNSISHFSS